MKKGKKKGKERAEKLMTLLIKQCPALTWKITQRATATHAHDNIKN